MKDQKERFGPWAIVTGASSGIGEGFARELASQGYHTVLVARREDRLKGLARELGEGFGVETRVVPADLSVPGAAQAISEAVADLDVGLLISNAGDARMGGFLQNRLEHLTADLHLNALSHMELVHRFASRLRAQDRSGGILLVSSTASLQPVGLAANYSGAKAFLNTLGESLHRELKEIDIDVTVLLPGPTDTHGLNHRDDIAMGKLPMPAMRVESLVREGLKALRRHKSSHVAGAMNRWSARLMPRRAMGTMLSRMLRPHTAAHLLPTAPIADAPTPSATRIGKSAA